VAVNSTGQIGVPLYRPGRIEPAYADIELNQIEALVRQNSPYANMAGAKGYEGFNLSAMAFFRQTWASDSNLQLPAAEPLFKNQVMIAAARRVFNAEVVRPMGLTVNVMGPMPARGIHVDSPTFRGMPHSSCPTWLIQVMGASRLFERWAVRIAGAVSWIYRQPGGGYKYWPDGFDNAAMVEEGPFGNVAVMGDNDYMYHQVQASGNPDRYAEAEKCGPKSEAYFSKGRWEIVEDGEVRTHYHASEIRISLLWRAYTFRDEAKRRSMISTPTI
jgi:hypothetical protein